MREEASPPPGVDSLHFGNDRHRDLLRRVRTDIQSDGSVNALPRIRVDGDAARAHGRDKRLRAMPRPHHADVARAGGQPPSPLQPRPPVTAAAMVVAIKPLLLSIIACKCLRLGLHDPVGDSWLGWSREILRNLNSVTLLAAT